MFFITYNGLNSSRMTDGTRRQPLMCPQIHADDQGRVLCGFQVRTQVEGLVSVTLDELDRIVSLTSELSAMGDAVTTLVNKIEDLKVPLPGRPLMMRMPAVLNDVPSSP